MTRLERLEVQLDEFFEEHAHRFDGQMPMFVWCMCIPRVLEEYTASEMRALLEEHLAIHQAKMNN